MNNLEKMKMGNEYLDVLEVEIIDMIRRNDPAEGCKLITLIEERSKIMSKLHDLHIKIYV